VLFLGQPVEIHVYLNLPYCLPTSYFWKPWPRRFVFGVQVHLHNLQVTFLAEGHRVKVKVTETKKT